MPTAGGHPSSVLSPSVEVHLGEAGRQGLLLPLFGLLLLSHYQTPGQGQQDLPPGHS